MDTPLTQTDKTNPEGSRNGRMEPKRLVMWLYVVSMTMMFAGLTSAVLVSMADNQAKGLWKEFQLPRTFIVSTIIIILSSLTLHWAYLSAKREKFSRLTTALWITVLLGVAFLTSQFVAFAELVSMNVYLVGSVSGSFVYVLTALHGVHIVAGVITLIVMLIKAIRYKIRSNKTLGLEMSMIFWHALGVLWIYLYVFLSNYYL